MRHKKKKVKNKKSHFGPIKIGCGASGLDCDGICSKLHSKDCIARFKYRWEYHKKFKQGRRKVIVKDRDDGKRI